MQKIEQRFMFEMLEEIGIGGWQLVGILIYACCVAGFI